MMKKQKAAFFDRDGTLIKDVSYLSNINQIELIPGIVKFCLNLQKADYQLFVVTNQSGIARGYFDESFVQETHNILNDIFLKECVRFTKWYYCPHGSNGICECRKPKPGMLLQAAQEYNLDLTKSLMFGDTSRDLEAGTAAGCRSFNILEALKAKNLL